MKAPGAVSVRLSKWVVLLFAFCSVQAAEGDSRKAAVAPRAVQRPMVVTAANSLAVQAGIDILRQGGDAVDAAIAVQAMLGLVEPQSSGVGGGAFMLRFDARTRRIEVYDGRETAPAAADARLFLDEASRPLPRGVAMLSGRSTGVPGVIAMLSLAHREHGKLRWSRLFTAAERQADAGFTISPRLGRFLQGNFPQATAPDVVAYFSRPDGERMRTGDTLRNPAYASFLRRLAAEGPEALYQGPVAQAIVKRLGEGAHPSGMTMADLAGYRPIKREPVCLPHGGYQLCSTPPPGSGAGLLQLMSLLEGTDIAQRGPDDPQSWYLFAEASRIMYADRDAWFGDPAFVTVPVKGLLDAGYVASRRALIGQRAGAAPVAGTPPGSDKPRSDATQEAAGTSHFVIVDGQGNAVAMTTTVESFFGSGRMVDGFFLNNELTDFSFLPEGPNAVGPGKRPRSSMSPTLILDPQGGLLGAIGSPGGNAIPAYVGKALVGLLDWGLPMQQAIDLPNLVARGAQFIGEGSRMSDAIIRGLAERGVVFGTGGGEDSGLHGVLWRNGQWEGGADSRREGRVMTAPPVAAARAAAAPAAAAPAPAAAH